MIGICQQLHSNLPAKLARLISYHEAKPFKLLKLPLETWIKKIYKLPIFFQNLNIIIKDLWSSSKDKISMDPTNFIATCFFFFSKPCMHVLQKDNYNYTISKSKYILFTYISISYMKFYIIGHKSSTYIYNETLTPFRLR